MHTMYEKVVSVVAKPVEDRTDIECMDLVAWFRNKSSLFQSLKAGKDKCYISLTVVVFLRKVSSCTFFFIYTRILAFLCGVSKIFCVIIFHLEKYSSNYHVINILKWSNLRISERNRNIIFNIPF